MPAEDRKHHGNYLRWCGCNPDSELEKEYLQKARETVDVEISHCVAIREALVQTADNWKDANELSKAERSLMWESNREARLEKQLSSIRASRKKLSRIAYRCQKAAQRRIDNKAYLAKAEYFRSLWYEKHQEEKRLEEKLKMVQTQKKAAKKTVRSREL